MENGTIKDLKTFQTLYQGEIQISEKTLKMNELAAIYHRQCESYDRIVCSEIKHGEATPTNGRELILINKNAKIVKEMIYAKASKHGITRMEMQRAIQGYSMRPSNRMEPPILKNY